jgi:hypothetical protein
MRSLLALDLAADHVARLRSILHYNGLPIDARSITDDVLVQEGLEAPKERHSGIRFSALAGED